MTNSTTHCKCNGEADLLNTPLPMRYQAGFGRSELKGEGINTGKKLKDCGALELCSLGTGGVADPQDTRPSPHVLPRQIW